MRQEFMLKLSMAILVLCPFLSGAQDIVDINVNVKHDVGGVSTFDRSKYIIIHDDVNGSEWNSQSQKKSFLEDYDVYFGRNNGSMIWQWNQVKEDPNKKGWPSIAHMQSKGAADRASYAKKTQDHQFENRETYMMYGGQEHIYPHGQATNPQSKSQSPWVYEGFEATAEFYANFLKYYFGDGGSTGHKRPTMLEVCNEPFVKAGQLGTTKLEMAKFHNSVAKRVKELNPDVLVGGYSAAYPMFEAANFEHWKSNWKMFIDVAGENMDYFSFHLYDGNSKYGKGQYKRAGSNIEAIMDMINHYSMIRLGKTLPFSISEYGDLPCKDCKDDPYRPANDWYNIRSFNNMILQFMERPDQILNAIPFVLLKANWAKPAGAEYNNYSSRLFRELGEMPGETPHGGYIYTGIVQFFQMWAHVNGTRVDTKSVDIDLLTDAYVDGNKMYLILSNLNWEDRVVKLNFMDEYSTKIQSIKVQHSYAINEVPQLDTQTYTSNLQEVTLGAEGTMILEYTFDKAINIDQTSSEHTYYADSYFKPITANTPYTFTFSDVNTAKYGEAILRLGLGRDHGKSLQPIVKINNFPIEVPTDFRGYDQKTRDRFFGVLEIPVPYDALLANNSIEITFPDGGGHITSVEMKVYNFSKEIKRSEKQLVAIQVSPENKTSKPGKTFQISASALPIEFQEGLKITWSSTNPTIASVDTAGVVTTYREGDVQIVASNPDKTIHGICELKVSNNAAPILANSISLDPKTYTMKNPGTLQMNAFFQPTDVDDTTVVWTSENEDVATVDANGLVTAVDKGTAKIVATTKDGSELSAKATITVPKFISSASCSEIPAHLSQARSYTFTIPYELGEEKDLLVSITEKDGFNAIAEGRVTVSKGNSSTEVNILMNGPLEAKEYDVWVRVVKVGGSWLIATSTCKTTVTVDADTPVNDVEQSAFSIYPNPAKNVVAISGIQQNHTRIRMYGLDGVQYFETKTNGSERIEVPLQKLQPGYYIIQVSDANGVQTFKISKI